MSPPLYSFRAKYVKLFNLTLNPATFGGAIFGPAGSQRAFITRRCTLEKPNFWLDQFGFSDDPKSRDLRGRSSCLRQAVARFN
ncbi:MULTISPECIES: hypothetical protein [Microcoleaceae]|uniref:hypothetical protein n=1 Tax=Microcoleaceae TaxID=1892252 RepID=UPI0018818F04|nr:hypothetical protein [Tychonema sp. LEGE 06208]MBE9165853.1 hypothetical protein [Tychonema sp. LEGE 06208]